MRELLFKMLKDFLGISACVACMIFSVNAHAATLNIAASSFQGIFDDYRGYVPCEISAVSSTTISGPAVKADSTSTCMAATSLLLPSGTVLSDIKTYVNDASASTSCKVYTGIMRISLSSSTGSINAVTTAFSNSVGNETLTMAGITLSSSYAYQLYAIIDPESSGLDCNFRGFKITY